MKEGLTFGVTAEHVKGVGLRRKQEGCLVEVEGSLVWEEEAEEDLQVTK